MAVPKKKPGPKPKPESEKRGAQPNALTIRGNATWMDWLQRLAKKHGLKPTAMIMLALAEAARKIEFEDPPSRLESDD